MIYALLYITAGFLSMEFSGWFIHKYLMHGPLWTTKAHTLVFGSQVFVVQTLPSSHDAGFPEQTPATHVSPTVHALSSSQTTPLSCVTAQPVAGSHVAFVHGLASLRKALAHLSTGPGTLAVTFSHESLTPRGCSTHTLVGHGTTFLATAPPHNTRLLPSHQLPGPLASASVCSHTLPDAPLLATAARLSVSFSSPQLACQITAGWYAQSTRTPRAPRAGVRDRATSQ